MSRLLWDAFDTGEWLPPTPGDIGHTILTLDPPNALEPTATYDIFVSAPGYLTPVPVRVFDLAHGETRAVTVYLDPISLPVIPPVPVFPSRPMRNTRRLINPQG